MKPTSFFTALALMATLLPTLALAGPGHDHDHGHDAPAASGPQLPRFAASSELFELVGVLEGRRLTLYLDRAADNAPVLGATIELEIAGKALKPVAHDDVYEVELAAEPDPGVLPVTATVTAGADIDLLAADFDIHADTPAAVAAHTHSRWFVAAGVAGAAALLAGLVLLGRRLAAARRAGLGAVA